MFTNSDCIVVIGLQCVELRLETIETIIFIRDFLLGTIKLRLEFLKAWIGIDIRGVIGDKLSTCTGEVAAVVDDSISFWDQRLVVGDGDGLPLVDA